MEMCHRCHKRVAVVFVTRIDNGTAHNEGLCLKCAKELGIKPISDYLEKMGIGDDELENMDDDINSIMQNLTGGLPEVANGDDDGHAPSINLSSILGGNMPQGKAENMGGKSDKNGDKTDKEKDKKRKYLSAYCIDLTKKARDGKLDKVIGRESEIQRMMQILCRRQKNNPCLIGEPGVGKTALAEALAQKIVTGDVPYKLKSKELYLLDLTSLIAGTQFRGQFESRIKGLIDEIKALGNIILVIDEVHNIASAGDAEGSMNAANILKPVLSRGELQVIGATTLKEYRKFIEKDSALERRFQPIILGEPNTDDTFEILRGIKAHYESYHGIKIPDETLRRIVSMADRYLSDRFFPDKAIDLLDEASAHMVMNSALINEIEETADAIKKIDAEKEALEEQIEKSEGDNSEKYSHLAELKSNQLKLHEKFDKLSKERDSLVLRPEDIAEVIEVWTGIPASTITESEFVRVDKLEERLKRRIVGQDEAISSVARSIKRNRAGVSAKRKPISFIFAGPTGVGKTELVKTLSRDLFHSPEALIRLDMSEFMEKHSVSRIIGAPPGYVGYDEAGQLTEKIRRKPYSVILFDEIEKAHPDVLNILLQILDDGRITDAQGRVVNFENTVIVMTTNAGSNASSGSVGFTADEKIKKQNNTEKALLTFLRPEFINRVDEIITFDPLDMAAFENIVSIMIGDLCEALIQKGLSLKVSDDAMKYIAKESFSSKYGARNMRRYIEKNLEDKIAELIISGYQDPPRGFLVERDEMSGLSVRAI